MQPSNVVIFRAPARQEPGVTEFDRVVDRTVEDAGGQLYSIGPPRDPVVWGRAYREAARKKYSGREYEHFPPDQVVVEEGNRGAWVEVLVWVPLESAEKEIEK